jgi:hypothetical protein
MISEYRKRFTFNIVKQTGIYNRDKSRDQRGYPERYGLQKIIFNTLIPDVIKYALELPSQQIEYFHPQLF